jgi:hypothetical protein
MVHERRESALECGVGGKCSDDTTEKKTKKNCYLVQCLNDAVVEILMQAPVPHGEAGDLLNRVLGCVELAQQTQKVHARLKGVQF